VGARFSAPIQNGPGAHLASRTMRTRSLPGVKYVARMGRDVYRVLVGKREGKRPLGRPRRRRYDNIKMDLQKVRCGGNGLDQAGSG
jgi:hypothetical protein